MKIQNNKILTAALAVLILNLLIQPADAGPAITITNVSPYGEADGFIGGFVTGVNFSDYKVAPYILVEGLGWYTKPRFDIPTVQINANGTFTVDVTTGGLDPWATIFCAALVPMNYVPPPANHSIRVPADLNYAAIDFKERYGRTIAFAGRSWAVKSAPGRVDPGQNVFSDRPADVWADTARLHVTIHGTNGLWVCTEVILLGEDLGYGTYVFKTRSRTDMLDVNAVLGLFTYDAYGDDESIPAWPYREIDFEDASWGVATNLNTQAVVPPWYVPGNRHRYSLPDLSTNSALTRIFIWRPESVRFIALRGDQSPTNYPPNSVFDDWTYLHNPGTNHIVPVPGRERVRFNLWLYGATAPANGQPVKVVISDFSFVPLAQPTITAIERIGNDVRLSFAGGLSNHYVVQSRTNISSGNWIALPGTTTGNAGIAQTTITNALNQPRQFYRIQQVP